VDFLVGQVQMDFQVSQVLKVFQVNYFLNPLNRIKNICFNSYIGDVGEPGLGGGYRPPSQKGEMGMCVRGKKRNITKLCILGEPGETGLPGIKGLPGDSGECMYQK
jgi:hypothetical protein